MDRTATNYNPNATIDDESCVYGEPSRIIYGCTNPKANNYNPLATIDDGSCVEPVPTIYGCNDPTQFNHAPTANAPCEGPVGCLPPNCNGPYSGGGCCVPIIYGCTDPTAGNYYSAANTNNGTCEYSSVCNTFATGTSIYTTPQSSSIVLEWVAPESAIGYIIICKLQNGQLISNNQITPTSGNNSYTIQNLEPNIVYDVTLQAVCAGSVFGPMETVTVTTLP